MKINASEIRVGMLLEYKGDLWQVLKTQHVEAWKRWSVCTSRNEKC